MPLKSLVRGKLSHFVNNHRHSRKPLILRATNLCKQGVTGLILVTSTKFFTLNFHGHFSRKFIRLAGDR
jgi:hypothetical protein